MKTLTLVILAVMLIGCSETNTTSPTQSIQQIETDIPCVKSVPVWRNQSQESGKIVYYPSPEGITFDLTNIPDNTNTVHIEVSSVQLSGNLAPGQFTIHIENPASQQYTFTWQELGINENCNIYVYIHFDTQTGTAWAGNIIRQGKGQWYFYSNLNCCN